MIGFKSIIYFIIAAAAGVLCMLFLHNSMSVAITAFIVLFPIFTVFLHRYALRNITAELDERNNNTELGYDRPVYITIKNTGIIPIISLNIDISIENMFYGRKRTYVYNVPVYPKSTQRLILKEPVFDCAGNYVINIERVFAWDFMHMYSFPQKIVSKKIVSVLPQPYNADVISADGFVNENSDTEESGKKGSDYPEIKDVREYIPGDSLKNIHWKLSAKKEMLMVKEHITLASDSIAVILELTDDGNYMLERIMRTAYTVLKAWTEKGVSYTVWWWSEAVGDMQSKSVNSRDDLYSCFYAVMHEKSYADDDKAKNAFSYVSAFVQKAVWINACTSQPIGDIVFRGGDLLLNEQKPPEMKKGIKNKIKSFFDKNNKPQKKTEAYVSIADMS